MQYTELSLGKSLELILPGCSKWEKSKWQQYCKDELVSEAIEKIFLFPDDFVVGDYEVAITVIRSAGIDLFKNGCIKYGTVDLLES